MNDHSVDHELVSTEEAAATLGIGVRMFQKLVKGGTIAPYTKRGNLQLFHPLDVKTLKEVRSEGGNLARLVVDARRSIIESRALRHELDLIRSFLGVNFPVLSLERDAVVSLTIAADEALKAPGIPHRTEILRWARTFHGIHEAYLEAVNLHLFTDEPWCGFLELGRKLCASHPPNLRTDRELETIYAMLHAGLRVARQAAYFYVRSHHGKTAAGKMFPEARSDAHEEVLLLAYSHDPD